MGESTALAPNPTARIGQSTIPSIFDERKLTDLCDSVNFQSVRAWTIRADLFRTGPARPLPATPFPTIAPDLPRSHIPRPNTGVVPTKEVIGSALASVKAPEVRATVLLPFRVISAMVGNWPDWSRKWWPGVVLSSLASPSNQLRRIHSGVVLRAG